MIVLVDVLFGIGCNMDIVLVAMAVSAHDVDLGKFPQQIENRRLLVRNNFVHRGMNTEDDELVFGYETQILPQPFDLRFRKSQFVVRRIVLRR